MKTDVEFARPGGVSLTLDAWVPDGTGPFPAAIVVHGGGFTRGDKQTFVKPLFEPLTRGGFAWFTINYRLAPEHTFPKAADDVESAIAWLKAHAAEYKVDPRRIALIGESAGGHLVSYVGARHKPQNRVAAVVSLYGPHDLAARAEKAGEISETNQQFFDTGALNPAALVKLRAASPITYVSRNMPPYLLIHGTADDKVPYWLSPAMCDKMKAAGARCELITVPKGGHGMAGWEKLEGGPAYKHAMVGWLHRTLDER